MAGVPDQSRVLEVLGPDAGDQRPFLRAAEAIAVLIRDAHVPDRQLDGLALDRGRHEVHRRRSDEARHEQVHRVVVELHRRPDLLQHPGAHHRHAVAERQRLGLVVGHVDRGGAESVWMRETSVRICTRSFASRLDSGSSIRNADGSRTIARPIATRWRWPPESWAGLRSRCCSRSRMRAASSTFLAISSLGGAQLQREAHVLAHAHVRIERVVLEHHRDVAVLGRLVVDDLVADAQLALADVLEPGDHPQRGRLPAPRRADEDDELAVLDLE